MTPTPDNQPAPHPGLSDAIAAETVQQALLWLRVHAQKNNPPDACAPRGSSAIKAGHSHPAATVPRTESPVKPTRRPLDLL